MNDDTLIRLENLRAMTLTPGQLAEKVGSSKQYWSDLLRGKKSFGERTARKIEERLQIPRGSLDQPVTHGDDRAFIDRRVGDVAQNSDAQPTIPTAMKYTAPNLRSAIMLIGNLLGALDEPSRDIVGDILLKVAKHSTDPGRVKDYAEKAATLATVQMPISENATINKGMRPRKQAVETGHGALR